MYTGGGECVLVKWTLANQHKSFLPRLPAPIKHLTIAPDNLYVAVSTLDNGKIFLLKIPVNYSRFIITNRFSIVRYCYCKSSKKIDVSDTKLYMGRCFVVQRFISCRAYC